MSEIEQDKREALADIVAEMREKAAHFEKNSELMVSENAIALFILPYADRIEAALKRERAAFDCECAGIAELAAKEEAARHKPGNAAAMREALLRCEAISCLPEIREQQCVRDMRNIIAAALSAPPRQCDVGTAEEQTKRLRNNCNTYKPSCLGCKHITDLQKENCWLAWAQTPYAAEKGAGK